MEHAHKSIEKQYSAYVNEYSIYVIGKSTALERRQVRPKVVRCYLVVLRGKRKK